MWAMEMRESSDCNMFQQSVRIEVIPSDSIYNSRKETIYLRFLELSVEDEATTKGSKEKILKKWRL